MKNALVQLIRWITGLLFVVSGLIKMNDPVGFSFKLEEYFGPDVLGLEFLMPFALPIAIVLVFAEVLLGFLLIMGWYRKIVLWAILLLIVFFTFLTFYSAYFNKVTDCGCFGDAIKLTPWQSFSKDVVLLVMVLFLWWQRAFIKPLLPVRLARSGTLLTTLACVGFTWYVIRHLPIVDFRPYKVGVNIGEAMIIPEDAEKPVYEYAWTFNENGQERVIRTSGNYPESTGAFVKVETRLISEGYTPPVHDFSMEARGEDHTAELLDTPKLFMIVARVLDEADATALEQLRHLVPEARKQGYEVIVLSASSEEESKRVKVLSDLDIPVYFCDLTTLKTIVRSNPGFLVLHSGTIVQKWHYNDADKISW